jgi:hypothetical protein
MPSRRAALAVIGALGCASACARPAAEPADVVRQDVELASDTDLTPGHVRPGENFGTLLTRQQIGSDQLEAMLASLEGVFDPRRMHEGQAWRLLRTGNGQVRLFEYEIDGRSVLRITPNTDTAGEFVAEVVPYNVRVIRVEVTGNINEETSSLFAAMSSAGEQPDLSVALADIFSGEAINTETTAWRFPSSDFGEGRATAASSAVPSPRRAATEGPAPGRVPLPPWCSTRVSVRPVGR